MSVFYLKGEKSYSVYAPCDGIVFPIDDIIGDEESAELSAEGFCILPCSTVLYSPTNGILSDISDDHTAYTVISDDGVEMLIKVKNEELLGNRLRTLAFAGQRLTRKDPLCSFELDILHQNDATCNVLVVLINSEQFSSITVFEGRCYASATEVMSFTKEDREYHIRRI